MDLRLKLKKANKKKEIKMGERIFHNETPDDLDIT